jgi:hypothetical protein
MITYRTTGTWGTGTGYNLLAFDIDMNFWALVLALAEATATPPVPGASISSVESTILEVRQYQLDGTVTTIGYNIPALNWRGDWEPDETYEARDVFIVEGDGVYLVLQDHTSDSDLDSDEYVLKVYGELIGEIATRPVIESEDIERPLTAEDDGCYVRCAFGSAFELADDFDGGWGQGSNLIIRQAGLDQVNVIPATGVAINVRGGTVARTRSTGSTMFLRRVGTNQWDCWGSLEV